MKLTSRKPKPFSWSMSDIDEDPKATYLKILNLTGCEEDARAISGFKGSVIHSRAKPHDESVILYSTKRAPDRRIFYIDEAAFADEELRAHEAAEAHRQLEKKNVIYSLAQNIQLYSDRKREVELLGFKGKSAMDAGFFYAPYLPLQVVSQTITAPSRMLAAGWTLEACTSMEMEFGIDEELSDIMAMEIQKEIDAEISNAMTNIFFKTRYGVLGLTEPNTNAVTKAYVDDNASKIQIDRNQKLSLIRER